MWTIRRLCPDLAVEGAIENMKPKDYTEEMLNRQFSLVVCHSGFHDDYKLTRPMKGGQWGIAETFTLREARDGLPPDRFGNSIGKLSKTRLEKLRRLKPGSKPVRMNSDKPWNSWWAVRLDPEHEEDLAAQIKEKKEKLKDIRAVIKSKVGDLQRQERHLRKELRQLEKKWLEI